MKVLILGYSRIVQKRVLPALNKTAGVDGVDVASRRGPPASGAEDPLRGRGTWFSDYETALRDSRADVVYISTANHEHATWTGRALNHGRHAIVDKPLTTTLRETEELARQAEQWRLGLAEALVYTAHPLLVRAREILREAGAEARHIAANFSFPPLAPDNFRCRRDQGGGALFDLGPYAVSPGRFFWGAAPDEVRASITGRHPGGVDTGFSMLLTYPGGRTVTGHFGFDTEYHNTMDVLGDGVHLRLDRVFTPPPDAPLTLNVRRQNRPQAVEIEPADGFERFLSAVLADFSAGRTAAWIETLRMDARALDALRRAAGETP